MTSPTQRQELIRQLLAAGPVRSQHELQDALARRGVAVNQATISRDLAALGVVRGQRGGGPAYLLPDDVAEAPALVAAARLHRLLTDLPISMDAAPPLLVLRTTPGAANAIASSLDAIRHPDVVGTVAGDDTIFIACRGRAGLARVREHLIAHRAEEAPPGPADPSNPSATRTP
jgi:transcriptional regulator of arginine metabolism